MRICISLLMIFLSFYAKEPDFGKYDGSGVVLDLNTSKRSVFGPHADEQLNPCSTFKLLNSMIALDAGVVKDENETIKWDGVVREYGMWNQNHTMRSAIAVSAVWFYQEFARRIGEKRMQEYVNKVHYGNNDTSKTLTDFWLGGGSLKISVNEEVDFLARLVRYDLPFSHRAMRTLKDIITLEKDEGYLFAGKTGTCNGIGWFVGFRVKRNHTTVFAFNIKGDGASGAEVKKIALEYFKED